MTATCNVLDDSWVVSGNRYSSFYENDLVHLTKEEQCEMLSAAEACLEKDNIHVPPHRRSIALVAAVHALHAETETVGAVKELVKDQSENASVEKGLLNWERLKEEAICEQVLERAGSKWRNAERPLRESETEAMKEVREKERRWPLHVIASKMQDDQWDWPGSGR